MSKHIKVSLVTPEPSRQVLNFKRGQRRKRLKAKLRLLKSATFDWAAGRPKAEAEVRT